MEIHLPKHFFMGAAMSGPQTEGAYKIGGKLENIWDTWSDCSISDFYNKVGSYVGNNFYEKYEEDIKLLYPADEGFGAGFIPDIDSMEPSDGSRSEAK